MIMFNLQVIFNAKFLPLDCICFVSFMCLLRGHISNGVACDIREESVIAAFCTVKLCQWCGGIPGSIPESTSLF